MTANALGNSEQRTFLTKERYSDATTSSRGLLAFVKFRQNKGCEYFWNSLPKCLRVETALTSFYFSIIMSGLNVTFDGICDQKKGMEPLIYTKDVIRGALSLWHAECLYMICSISTKLAGLPS